LRSFLPYDKQTTSKNCIGHSAVLILAIDVLWFVFIFSSSLCCIVNVLEGERLLSVCMSSARKWGNNRRWWNVENKLRVGIGRQISQLWSKMNVNFSSASDDVFLYIRKCEEVEWKLFSRPSVSLSATLSSCKSAPGTIYFWNVVNCLLSPIQRDLSRVH
jgi:hypothetical protein